MTPSLRFHTANTYRHAVEGVLIPALGAIRLQALKPIDVQRFYAEHAHLAPATVHLHAAVLSAAMKSAVKNQHISRNPVPDADGKTENRADA